MEFKGIFTCPRNIHLVSCSADCLHLIADDAAAQVRDQIQRDRRSSVTSTIAARMNSQPSASEAPGLVRVPTQSSVGSKTPEFSHIAEHAMHQLHEAHAYAKAVELQEEAQKRIHDASKPAALGLMPIQASKSPAAYSAGAPGKLRPPKIIVDATADHLSRLSPSMPLAPSRTNTIDRHNAAQYPNYSQEGTCNGLECSPGLQQVHFDSYADPHTFDVAPPATPHPSKGLLNPPRDGGTPDSSGHAHGVSSLQN